MNRMEIKKKQLMILSGMLLYVTVILLTNMIGDLGMAYFAAAAEFYMLFWLLLTAGIPDYVEKLVRSRIAKGQYKNADKVFVAALGYGLAAGILGGVILFFGSRLFTAGLLQIPEASLALKLLAPLFFLSTVCAVLQGYFQGIGTAMPTVVSGILKQLSGLLFAALFGSMLRGYGEKAGALLHNSKFASMYGAAGAALGFLCAAFLPLLFLILIYFSAGRRARRKAKEGMRLTEDGIEVLRLLILSMLPAAGTYFLGRLSILTGLFFYQGKQTDLITGLTAYGAFYGKYLAVAGLLIAVVLLVVTGVEGEVIHMVKKEEYKNAKTYLRGGIQSVLMLAGFLSMLCLTLAPGFARLLFGEGENIAASCIRHGSLFVLFFSMGVYFTHILSGIGRQKTVLLVLLGAFLFFVIAVVAGLKLAAGNVLALVYAQLVFAVAYCLISGFFLFRAIRYNPDWVHAFVLPSAAVLVTGLCTFLLNQAFASLAGEALAAVICTFIGGGCYLVLLFVFRCINQKDLYVLPGGRLLGKVGAFLHFL